MKMKCLAVPLTVAFGTKAAYVFDRGSKYPVLIEVMRRLLKSISIFTIPT